MKVIRCVLCVLIVFTVVVVSTPISGAEQSVGFGCRADGDGTVITAPPDEAEGELTIPDELGGRPVIGIDVNAFKGNSDITGVKTGSQLRWIGMGAFTDCTELESVELPASLERIDSFAFEGCTALENVSLPDGLRELRSAAFKNCAALGTVALPDGIAEVPPSCFEGCASLVSVRIPNGIREIGDSAFADCVSLSSLSIPGTVYGIGSRAFYGCTSLADVSLPDTVVNIGRYAFSAAPCSAEINGDGTVYIGSHLISAVSPSGRLTVRDGTVSIAEYALSGCRNVSSVEIPGSVVNIGDSAFYNCTGIESFTVDGSNRDYFSEDGVLFCRETAALLQYPCGNSRAAYTVPEGIEIIGKYAFCGCSKLIRVSIPDSVWKIGLKAFYRCASLTDIDISGASSIACVGGKAFDLSGFYNEGSNWVNGVLYLGGCLVSADPDIVAGLCEIAEGTRLILDGAFEGCDGLTEISLPRSLFSIGDSAFADCGLRNVFIPPSVAEVGRSAFDGNEGIVINCVKNSAAAKYAAGDGIETVFTGTVLSTDDPNAVIDDLKGLIRCASGDAAAFCESLSSEAGEVRYEHRGVFVATGDTVYVCNSGELMAEYIVAVYGDVNSDGFCDAQDAVAAQCLKEGLISADRAALTAADCNGDGAIGRRDIMIMIDTGVKKG